jgi:hypothetical protein
VIIFFVNDVIVKDEILLFIQNQYKLRHFIDWNIPKELLINSFGDATYTKAQVIDVFYQCYLKTHTPEKEIWGDKNINTLSYISEIMNLFPQTKFIHIVRDGRDVAASLQSRVWKFYSFIETKGFYLGHFKGAIDTWKTAIDIIENEIEKYPESLLITVKYEDLIQDPETTLNAICNHIGIAYDTDMLLYYNNEKKQKTISNRRLKGTHENILKPLIKDNSKKFLNFYSKKQLAYIEFSAQKQLLKNGYRLEASRSISIFYRFKVYVFYCFGYAVNICLHRVKQFMKNAIK